MASPATEFKLQRVEARVGPIALVTMDNGADWQKPNTFGEAALRSLEGVLDRLRTRDWRGLLLTGKPFVFAAGADIDEFGDITPERARLGRSGRARALRPLSRAPVRHGCRSERGGARRRRRDRPALRLPDDFVVGSALRLPRGVPRTHPRLGRNAARPAARGCGGGGAFRRRESAPPEPHASPGRRRSRPASRTRCFEPVEFVDESLAFLLEKVEEGAGKRRPERRSLRRLGGLPQGAARLDGQVHGAAPAPYRALDLIEGAATWSLEEGYRAEEDALAELLPGPEAQASVYAFGLVERRAKRGAGAPEAEPRRVQRVGIVGAGLMARQLALLFLRRLEVPVVLRDLTQEQVDDAVAWIADELADLVRRGRLAEGKARFLGSLVTGGADWEVFAGCDLVLEAVFEELSVKQEVFAELEQVVSPGVRSRHEHLVALRDGDGC